MPDITASSEINARTEHPAATHADSVVAIHQKHERRISRHQKAVENITFWIGRPFLLYLCFGLSLAWIFSNLFAPNLGFRSVDRAPYPVLQSIWSLSSLVVTIIVLITQNRQAKIDQNQAQLSLQLSLLADQKTAKIISLLEELRRDTPSVPNRVDPEADALTETVHAEDLASDLEKRITEVDLDRGMPALKTDKSEEENRSST